MNRFAVPLIGFVLLVAAFVVVLNRNRAPERQFVASALIGKPAPEFELPNLLEPGATVKSSTFKGRWYLLNVWGTWCKECRAEHAVLLEIQRAGKVAVVGLNYKDEDASAQQWLMELGNPYEAVAVDREGRAAIDYGVYGAPESFLVNPQGIIVHKVVGGVTPESWHKLLLQFVDGAKP